MSKLHQILADVEKLSARFDAHVMKRKDAFGERSGPLKASESIAKYNAMDKRYGDQLLRWAIRNGYEEDEARKLVKMTENYELRGRFLYDKRTGQRTG